MEPSGSNRSRTKRTLPLRYRSRRRCNNQRKNPSDNFLEIGQSNTFFSVAQDQSVQSNSRVARAKVDSPRNTRASCRWEDLHGANHEFKLGPHSFDIEKAVA